MHPPIKWHRWCHPANHEPPDMWQTWGPMLAAWRPWIKEGVTCLDVGAYTGDTTIPLAILAGPLGKVFAFEPNPHVYSTLVRNATQTPKIAPITTLPVALTPKGGPATFHYSDLLFCNGGQLLGPRDYKIKHCVPLSVQSMRFADWITPEVGFIKLDTEGNELALIKSAADQIKTWRPNMQLEVYPDLTADERHQLRDTLLDMGFSLRAPGGSPDIDWSNQNVFDILAIWT